MPRKSTVKYSGESRACYNRDSGQEPLSNMANTTNLNKKLTEAQLKDLEAMLRDKAFSYADIADAYGVGINTISIYALKHGLRRHKERKTRNSQKKAAPSTLKQVEAELEQVATQERELKRRIEELQQRRQELQIRFESDGTDVLVYGVAPQVLRATALEWLTFLNAEGARRLREFCLQAVKR